MLIVCANGQPEAIVRLRKLQQRPLNFPKFQHMQPLIQHVGQAIGRQSTPLAVAASRRSQTYAFGFDAHIGKLSHQPPKAIDLLRHDRVAWQTSLAYHAIAIVASQFQLSPQSSFSEAAIQ
jgi:hypothetical protein